MTDPLPAILAIATGVPEHSAAQEDITHFVTNMLEASLPPAKSARWTARVRALCANSRIKNRYSVIADYRAHDPRDFEFFPRNWQLEPFPTTAQRMELYESASVELARQVAEAALIKAKLDPTDITHLIVCTCTGFFAPGPDVALVQKLGLLPSTPRTLIGFMGCHSGFNGLRTARDIVVANPKARVLQICVELCSIHLQKESRQHATIANCLFGDGCSATIYGQPRISDDRLVRIESASSLVAPHSTQQMAWRIRDTGFEMHLSSSVPDTIGQETHPFVNSLLDRAGRRLEEVAAWAIHPGGPRILDVVAESLGLEPDSLDASHSVLRDFGNMSSPTIFFVLDRLLGEDYPEDCPSGPITLLGFGPGLTIEGAVLSQR